MLSCLKLFGHLGDLDQIEILGIILSCCTVTNISGTPTTAELPAGSMGTFYDTVGNTVYIAVNVSGNLYWITLTEQAPPSDAQPLGMP